MLFNSLDYILLFLPATLAIYFVLGPRLPTRAGTYWLVAASLFFYGYWKPEYLPLILLSICGNFLLGSRLCHKPDKRLLTVGITGNLLLLGYYKYAVFIVTNINSITGLTLDIGTIELPLAISFFTFLQIAYLVDCHQKKSAGPRFAEYCLFVTYFPHLIAGPLVHHRDLIPQFSVAKNHRVNWHNVYLGLILFSIGLFKKVCIADTFAAWANTGFNSEVPLGFFDAWGTSLSYSLQLYYDFSGYSDMAIGASLLFNIRLPQNFNSPYKALDIQDFWRRWHMTLSQWLRDYLYIPLGGSRCGHLRTYVNLFITFLLGGLWHGASWNFVIWGALHGLAVAIHRAWSSSGLQLPRAAAWLLTFLFVNFTWVFFRAETLPDALRVLSGMINIHSAALSPAFAGMVNYIAGIDIIAATTEATGLLNIRSLLLIIIFMLHASLAKNSMSRQQEQSTANLSLAATILCAACLAAALFQMIYMPTRASEFIYFNF